MKAAPDIRSNARRMRRTMTKAETILWSRLKARQLRGWQFRRQHPIGRYIADFACPKARLVVEIDGATHSSDRERAYDAARQAFIEGQGWSVLRCWNDDIYSNLGGVIDTILTVLPPSAPDIDPGHLPPSAMGGGNPIPPRTPLSSPHAMGGGVAAGDGGGNTQNTSGRTSE